MSGGATPRTYTVAVSYGLLAGAVTALTFALMRGLQHLVWFHEASGWYIAVVVMTGGVLLALLRPAAPQPCPVSTARRPPEPSTVLLRTLRRCRRTRPGSSRLPLLCASVAGFIAFVLTWRLLGLQTHALELAGGQSEVMDSVLAVVPAVAKVAAIALSLAAGWRGGGHLPPPCWLVVRPEPPPWRSCLPGGHARPQDAAAASGAHGPGALRRRE